MANVRSARHRLARVVREFYRVDGPAEDDIRRFKALVYGVSQVAGLRRLETDLELAELRVRSVPRVKVFTHEIEAGEWDMRYG